MRRMWRKSSTQLFGLIVNDLVQTVLLRSRQGEKICASCDVLDKQAPPKKEEPTPVPSSAAEPQADGNTSLEPMDISMQTAFASDGDRGESLAPQPEGMLIQMYIQYV